jgi:hypothetical protein
MAENPTLELLELQARLETKVVNQVAACLLQRCKRIGLSPGPIERDHQLSNQSLPVGIRGDKTLENRHELSALTRRESSFDQRLLCCESAFFESDRLGGRERLEKQVSESGPPPQRERLGEQPRSAASVASRRCISGSSDEPVEAVQVDLGGLDA